MNKESYILEEKWFGSYRYIISSTNIEDLINYIENLQKRVGPYGKIKFRIREKDNIDAELENEFRG
jgi:hypothetical protein